ncbi:hypothetical protein FVEN_g6453 [Fusarium venenatum]|nr:hypothetical protein FVEN_g6453 [Fusarium venenatum]
MQSFVPAICHSRKFHPGSRTPVNHFYQLLPRTFSPPDFLLSQALQPTTPIFYRRGSRHHNNKLSQPGASLKMLEHLVPWSPVTEVTDKIKIDDLTISFKRTIRVSDNKSTNDLPPDMGEFPLSKMDDYAETIPLSMAEKGGVFIPMYQREALWIGFESTKKYVIRVFVGGINAVSGEPKVPHAATSLRRRTLISQGKSVQDYLFVPGQRRLDGVAVEGVKVRQFVAMPAGTGHSIETQIIGEEVTGGIQFEVTRLDIRLREIKTQEAVVIMVKSPISYESKILIGSREENVFDLKTRYEAQENVPIDLIRCIHGRNELEDNRTLKSYGIRGLATIEMVPRLRGGGKASAEMHMSAGGRITQGIVALQKRSYSKTVPIAFNVQVLNSASFERLTDELPPVSPVSTETYAKWGFPFFSIYEEPSAICGDFTGVKSIAEIYKTSEKSLPDGMLVMDVRIKQVRRRGDGLLDPEPTIEETWLAWELEEELMKTETLF